MADNSGRGSDGKFLPNNPGKPKGASKNKLRDKIRAFCDNNFDNLPEWFDRLKPKEKVDAYLSLLPYVVSRLQSVSMTDIDGNDLTPKAIIDYSKLSDSALSELLEHTTINNIENEN